MTRHEMRTSVFLLCFERIFHNDSAESMIEAARDSDAFEISEKAEKMFKSIDENAETIDEKIKPYLKEWDINRISKVALAVLRVAFYEILFVKDDDISVFISEAVKITEEFAFKDDIAFVNGVLSSLSKDLA